MEKRDIAAGRRTGRFQRTTLVIDFNEANLSYHALALVSYR